MIWLEGAGVAQLLTTSRRSSGIAAQAAATSRQIPRSLTCQNTLAPTGNVACSQMRLEIARS